MTKRPNVLMIAPRYKPAIGGVEKHVEKISANLRKLGYSITILTHSHESGLATQENVENIDVYRIPFGWKNMFPLVFLWILQRRKIFSKYDIVHVHGTMPLLFWYLPLRMLNSKVPTYVTFHGYERDPIPVIFKILRRIARKLVKKSLCIGQFIETMYQINCDEVSIGAVEESVTGMDKGEGVIYVGRLENDTGIIDHIHAMKILKEKYRIDLQLTVCGKGSLEQELKKLVSDLNANVNFEGLVPNSIDFIKRNKFCLAAGYLSILEAMSLGLPVISVTKSRLKHLYFKGVSDAGGPISIQTSSEGVAREIVRLVKNPDIVETIGERGKQFARKMTWERMTEVYLKMWRTK